MVPLPNFASIEELNAHLKESCIKRQSDIIRGHTATITQRLGQESFLPLPCLAYECCRVQLGKINSQSLVRFGGNDYSVPTQIGQQKVLIKGYVDRVVIIFENQIIADHIRGYGKEEVFFNPFHYLKLLERKTGVFDQAAPLKGWNLPPVFQKVHDILYRRDGKEGRREYIRILQLLETYGESIMTRALEEAVHLQVIQESSIRHLLRRIVEGRPLTLSLKDHPNVPHVHIALPNLKKYTAIVLKKMRYKYG
jgi:hypothetical protein